LSDLQLSLIGIGAAAVAGVFAYNKWQERQHRKLAERVFRSEHADVLLGTKPGEAEAEERVEPVLLEGGDDGSLQHAAADEPRKAGTAGEPRRTGTADEPRRVGAADEPPLSLVDAAIDCVVRFESAEVIGGGYLWQAQHLALGKLARPVSWVGLNERSGAWELLTANGGGDYRRLRAALQLADRRGPLSDGEISLFFNGVQRVAEEFLAVADIPARGESLARAADLDKFCAGVDIQIGVNVVGKEGVFPGTKLRGLAEASGLVLREDGMFHALDDAGNTLYTLSNLEPALFAADELKVLTTHGVTFILDVPRVADGAAAFDRMLALAQKMADSLGGTLVDDNRAPLANTALDVIRDKIVEIEQRMTGHGIAAGGSQALRLFS
jgi:FtsZ-interacting cell division protein ZipA